MKRAIKIRFMAAVLLFGLIMTIQGRDGVAIVQAAGIPGFLEPETTQNPPSEEGETEYDDFVVSGETLIRYQGTSSYVTIPSDVRYIDTMAFYSNLFVKAVCIPSSVDSVDMAAFYNCPYLRYIVFEGNTKMGNLAVYKCERLKNISAPKGSLPYQYAVSAEIPVTVSKKCVLAEKKVVLMAGKSKKNNVYNSYKKVTWKSSKKKVATVTSSGKIKAVRPGKAVISAKVEGKTLTCRVTVKKRTMKSRINMALKEIQIAKKSRYAKIKAVHNWLIANVEYDYDGYLAGYVPAVSHTAYGALIKGVAVCDGYSYAFGKFMEKLNIPCRIVVGRSGSVGHAWNMVKLGGKWYHIDVTFDDPIVNGSSKNKKPYYEYFLRSSRVMRKTHTWKVSAYPKCKSRKYDG